MPDVSVVMVWAPLKVKKVEVRVFSLLLWNDQMTFDHQLLPNSEGPQGLFLFSIFSDFLFFILYFHECLLFNLVFLMHFLFSIFRIFYWLFFIFNLFFIIFSIFECELFTIFIFTFPYEKQSYMSSHNSLTYYKPIWRFFVLPKRLKMLGYDES